MGQATVVGGGKKDSEIGHQLQGRMWHIIGAEERCEKTVEICASGRFLVNCVGCVLTTVSTGQSICQPLHLIHLF